jgi:hypothetical protein
LGGILWFWIALVILLPTALLACIGPVGRLAFVVLGLPAFAAFGFADLSGPHNPAGILPLAFVLIAIGAVLAEAAIRIWRLVHRGRTVQPE